MTLVPTPLSQALSGEAKAIYLEAFPKEERLPWWLLRLNATRQGIDITGWLEEGRLRGITISVTEGGLHFLLFFAIHPQFRGRGYGSAILEALKAQYETVVLNVEPLVADAPNLSQRQRRFRFYSRCGFRDTGYHVWEVGGMFRVLSTRETLDVPAYKKIFRKLTLGFWDVKLEKA
jgi:GNAT superfamily N-acetyltransferase